MKRTETKQYVCIYIYMCVCVCIYIYIMCVCGCLLIVYLLAQEKSTEKSSLGGSGRTPKEHAWTLEIIPIGTPHATMRTYNQ